MLDIATDVSLAQLIIGVGLVASAFCYLVAMYSAEEFFAQRGKDTGPGPRVGISVLKPLYGLDIGLYDNLASLCRQDYETFQIICGVADEDDPAAAVVRRLQRDFADVDVELVVDDRLYGANHKVSNLINMLRHARHDLIVIADSDIRVSPTYFSSLDRAVGRPGVGLATCPYRALNRGPLPTLVESLFINTDFMPLVMLARKVEKSTYAFGSTIAIRRGVLDEIGGFLPLVNSLADDYQLGYRVAEKGYQLALVPEPVDTMLAISGWRKLFDHQLRWARTYRICRPAGYFTSIVTHGTLWSLVNVLYHGFSPTACLASAVVLGLRYTSAMTIAWRHLRAETSWAAMLAVPLKDLFFDLIWLLAFAGDTVVWGGSRFRVDRSGEMIEIGEGPKYAAIPSPQRDADPNPDLPRTAQRS